jgi:hypothetical protein
MPEATRRYQIDLDSMRQGAFGGPSEAVLVSVEG